MEQKTANGTKEGGLRGGKEGRQGGFNADCNSSDT
jgi:hypothetical protein